MNLHTIKEHTENFSPLNSDDLVGTALDMMSQFVLRCYPVIENNKLIGYVWKADLEHEDQDSPIADLIRKDNLVFLQGDEHIFDIVEKLIGNRMDCIAIIDYETGDWRGAVRAWDVLRVISESATFFQNGSCIVLEMSSLQYSLSKLAQICEHEDMQVIGVLIDKMDSESNVIQVHLKLNGHNLERLVGAMKRFDFEVPYYSQPDTEPGVIKERYDSLMKFLDI